jgi:hypothetical protein
LYGRDTDTDTPAAPKTITATRYALTNGIEEEWVQKLHHDREHVGWMRMAYADAVAWLLNGKGFHVHAVHECG